MLVIHINASLAGFLYFCSSICTMLSIFSFFVGAFSSDLKWVIWSVVVGTIFVVTATFFSNFVSPEFWSAIQR